MCTSDTLVCVLHCRTAHWIAHLDVAAEEYVKPSDEYTKSSGVSGDASANEVESAGEDDA